MSAHDSSNLRAAIINQSGDFLARVRVGLAIITFGTKRLQISQFCFATVTPRIYVVNLKLNSSAYRRALAAGATSKAVTLKDAPTKPKRRVSTRSASGCFSASLYCERFDPSFVG